MTSSSGSGVCRDTSNCLTVAVRNLEVVSATPSACNPNNNTYSLSVELNYIHSNGSDLTISTGDRTFTVSPDGSGSQTFQLNNLNSRAAGAQNVRAAFVQAPACRDTLFGAFTPPARCIEDLEDTYLCAASGGVDIDLLGNPIANDTPVCVDLSSKNIDPTEADSLLLWVFSRRNRPTSVTFTSDNGLSVTIPQNQGIAAGGNGFYYRVMVPADGSTNYCAQTAGNNKNDERSFGTFVYHTPPEGDGAVSSIFTGRYLFYNRSLATSPGVEDCLTRFATVAAGNAAQRDIVLQIAIDDLEANDPRTIDFEFTAGSINDSYTRSGPTFDMGSLGIYEFTLENVPQNVTEVEIEICSRQATNGQSLFFTGVIADGTAGCAQNCALSIDPASVTPSACDPATNTYTLDLTVNYENFPAGYLEIVVSDTVFRFAPDGSGMETLQLTDLPGRGVEPLDLIARFAQNQSCADTLQNAYTPPAGCRGNLETEDPCVPTNGVVIDLLGTPITDDSQYCLNLANEGIDPAQTDSLLLWVFSRNNKPTSVTFTSDNGLNITLDQNQGVAAGGSGFYYRTKVAADGSTNYCAQTAGNNQNNERSFGSFVFHSPPGGNGAVSSTFIGEYLFWNSSMATDPGTEDCLTLIETVAAGDQAQRDIVLQIAVDDLEDNDPRTIDFEFTAGSINDSYTRSGPTFDLGSLGIYEFTIENVPQSVTDIEIEVCSKQVNDGQSLFFTGVVADAEAGCATNCSLSIDPATVTTTNCDPNTNTYVLGFVFSYDDLPGSGEVLVSLQDSLYSYHTEGTSPDTVLIGGLHSRQAQPIDLIVYAAADSTCADTLHNAYTPPLGCGDDFETTFPCASENGTEIETLGIPVTDDSQYCLDLTNNGIVPAQADSLLLWVFSRGNQPDFVTFTSDNGLNVVVIDGISAGGGGFYYRTKVAADGSTNYCAQTAGNNQNNERSFGSFVFHTPPDGDGAVSSTFIGEYLFWNQSMATDPGVEDCLTLTETVAAGDRAQRDIVLQIAVDDLENNDPRTIDFEFTAGSINDSYTRSGPTFDLGSLGIYEFTIENVPQSVTDIEIEVCSKQVNDGQSLYFTGVVANADAGCQPCQLSVSTNDPEICTGESATITATPTNGDGNYTYSWTVPTGETDPGDTNSFSAATDGDYIVTVTDGAGCTATDTSTVVINSNPTVSVNDPTVCEGETKTIMATVLSGPSPYNYAWSVPMGVSDPGDVASFAAGTEGAYTVTVTDGNGCTATGTGNLTVLPNATGEENYTGCEGDGYSVEVNGTTYNEMNPMGTETLMAANGCDSVVTINLIYFEGPTVSVADQSGICEGDAATITATVSGGGGSNSYQWSVPAGVTDPGDVMSFQSTEPGTYAVTVTDSNGCTGTDSGELSVVTLTATINAVACEDNGTPAISTDDYFTFTLIADQNGANSTTYEVVRNAQPDGAGGTVIATGNYGDMLTLGQDKQFAADGNSTYPLTIRESGGDGCFIQETVGPVEPCSNCPNPNCGPVQIQENSRDGME